jgi:Type I phosphodiesterase / nucleotide pyrophosphatase
MALVAALAAIAASAATAGAAVQDCQPQGCVILIEVDGLEPQDVTQTGTPFLWALAHPDAAGASDALGTAYDNALMDRNGFMWQAGRAPMTASTATSAASLLTGANADQHGVLADEFLDREPADTNLSLRRLRAASDTGDGEPVQLGVDSLFELATNSAEATDPQAWAFIGNPALAVMLDESLQLPAVGEKWWPTNQDGSDPSLCPVPRRLPTVGDDTPDDAAALPQRDCPARDGTTLEHAFSAFSDNPGSRTPLFAYIHLAELGRMKQLHGDAQVPGTLQTLDAALAAFVEGLANHPATAAAWRQSVLVVTGNHGYEPTPLDRRVPHPEHVGALDWDFADYLVNALEGANRTTTLVPQGTVATVYVPADATADELAALQELIEEKGNQGCQELAGEDCIEEVAPVATLAALHQTWALNPLTEAGEPTGAGGHLVVTAKPEWAFGRVTERRSDALGEVDAEATNPYPGSAGGPRNRAIAVLMNGPEESLGLPHTIRQVDGEWMAARSSAQRPPACTAGAAKTLAEANAPSTMADDAAAPGHECQPETVDIALSIAGMLKLDTDGVPLAPQARFLNEAFTPPLGAQEVVEDTQPEVPQPEPPPPPAPIVIVRGSVQVITPPPPKDPFPYRGLIRRLRVRVTDGAGRAFALARRGAALSTIQVQADFGKPESLVTLTFYKRRGGPGRRARLSAIARFKPFSVKRGPVRLRLRIPSRFRPTHLGVSVQQIETTESGEKRAVGRPGGGIAQIADARRLHTRKGASRRGRR